MEFEINQRAPQNGFDTPFSCVSFLELFYACGFLRGMRGARPRGRGARASRVHSGAEWQAVCGVSMILYVERTRQDSHTAGRRTRIVQSVRLLSPRPLLCLATVRMDDSAVCAHHGGGGAARIPPPHACDAGCDLSPRSRLRSRSRSDLAAALRRRRRRGRRRRTCA